jgi:hypothetical protein
MNGGRGLGARWGGGALASGALLLAMLFVPLACVSYDTSFKTVIFEGVDREKALDVCQRVIATHFYGTQIRIDRAAGHIETDPVEEPIAGKTMREQCYVDVKEHAGGRLEIALLARMQQMKIDPSAQNPVEWMEMGSDVQVEGMLLDEISGRLLALETDAKVIETTVPRTAKPR